MKELQQTIKAAIAGFAATKAEYALPDNDIDAAEMYTYAVAFEKITTELVWREKKLVEALKEIGSYTTPLSSDLTEEDYHYFDGQNTVAAVARNTLKELGIEND